MEALKITIKVNKLDKTAFFKGKNGDTYCSILLWPNHNEDEYGNIATIKQDLGAERKGEKTEIVGNAKPLRKRQDAPTPKPQTLKAEFDDADEVPF